MENKPRVLVVEDVETMRESHIDNLERENFKVDGAGSFQQAHKALERRSYHVAIVDIMLGGESDFANRDGVRILEYIQTLGEGTRPIVVSRQAELQRVRDFMKHYGAFDYLAKVELERVGVSLLIQMVRDAVAASSAGRQLSWEELCLPLTWGTTEAFFVSDCLSRLRFRGGFEHFSRSLLTVGRNLMPLMVRKTPGRAVIYDNERRVFRGVFWSKGQGEAIELVIGGADAEPSAGKDQAITPTQVLHSGEKNGLSILVLRLVGLEPSEFAKPGVGLRG